MVLRDIVESSTLHNAPCLLVISFRDRNLVVTHQSSNPSIHSFGFLSDLSASRVCLQSLFTSSPTLCTDTIINIDEHFVVSNWSDVNVYLNIIGNINHEVIKKCIKQSIVWQTGGRKRVKIKNVRFEGGFWIYVAHIFFLLRTAISATREKMTINGLLFWLIVSFILFVHVRDGYVSWGEKAENEGAWHLIRTIFTPFRRHIVVILLTFRCFFMMFGSKNWVNIVQLRISFC